MRLGETPRPLGMFCEARRVWDDLAGAAAALDGMSMMFSLRPVVGSVVWSLAGS